jgi:hypothetical protein
MLTTRFDRLGLVIEVRARNQSRLDVAKDEARWEGDVLLLQAGRIKIDTRERRVTELPGVFWLYRVLEGDKVLLDCLGEGNRRERRGGTPLSKGVVSF